MADPWLPVPDGCRKGLIAKEQKITFWGDGNFFCAVQYGTPSHIWLLSPSHMVHVTEGLDF